MIYFNIKLLAAIMLFLACTTQEDLMQQSEVLVQEEYTQLSYLALGDSYTIGESVTAKNSFPKQLEKRLENDLNTKIETEILAKTGWRTDNVLDAITDTNLKKSYDYSWDKSKLYF